MEDIKPDIGIKMDGIEPYIGIKMKGLEPDIGIKMESVKPNIGIKVEAVKPNISTESPNPDVSIKMEAVKPNISIESPNPDVGIKMQESDCWPEVMTFTPTMEEFSSLKNLLAFMESKGAHKAGIAKIKPPGEWIARSKGYQVRDIDIEIQHPVLQTISPTENAGAFQANHQHLPPLRVEEYRKLATKDKYVTPPHESYDQLETMYWNLLLDDKSDPPIYGADVCDSITDPEQKIWNINRLDSILTDVMEEQIPGVNMPYLYFGMWRATFSWHVEDMDLYGVNFLHYGAPKTWYCVPPQYGYKLEQTAQKLFPHMTAACFNLLRHKAFMFSPEVLEEHGVRVNKVVQEERDMIVVFPHAYHSGFNHGFNIAESTNFALPRWIEYGKRFRGCLCGDKDQAVVVNMAPFINKYQHDRYEAWSKGKDFDLHPEDPAHLRQAYQDASCILDDDDLQTFKNHIRTRREIPEWFIQMFSFAEENKPVYEDRVDLFKNFNMFKNHLVKQESKQNKLEGPRYRRVRLNLLENTDTFSVKLKPLRKIEVFCHMRKLKRQEAYEKAFKDSLAAKKVKLAESTTVSNGFAGANIDDMIAKKAMMTCSKKHRFRACAKCSGCRTPNCGDCMNCYDMPMFGGPGTAKQKCVKRVCINPRMQQCNECKWIGV